MIYYNDTDKDACVQLVELMRRGLIAPGDIDDRSIELVQPGDVAGYTQCHFFAGLGVWSHAARLAGWGDERRLWTGSCPCQPWSVAGRRRGAADPRDLWPHFFRLINACRPPVVLGEQVPGGAVGRERITEEMQRVWRGEDFAGFLSDPRQARQFDWLSCEMQGLLQDLPREIQDYFAGAEIGYFQEISGGEPGPRPGECGALSSQASGDTVQLGRVGARTSGAHRQREVRAFWDAVSAGRRPDLGQSLLGSGDPGGWLRDHECPGGLVRPECDDEHVGRGARASNRGKHAAHPRRAGRGPAGKVGTKTEGEAGEVWIDRVSSDLDKIDYAFRSFDIPSCAVDSPDIRQRLYWGALVDGSSVGWGQGQSQPSVHGRRTAASGSDAPGLPLGDGDSQGLSLGRGIAGDACEERATTERADDAPLIAMANGDGPGELEQERHQPESRRWSGHDNGRNGSWYADHEWIECHDGKKRRAPPDIALLAPGFAGRIPLWRGLGGAINAQLAKEVIAAFMEVHP